MTNDEVEFLISQRLDGTLIAAEAARLDELAASDGDIAALVAEHTTLDAALRRMRTAVEVDPDWLSAQISDRIDQANARPIRLHGWGWAAPAAMAACLLIGLTLGTIFLRDDGTPLANTTRPPTTATPLVEVTVAAIGPRTDTGFINVSVGTPADLTPQIVTALYLVPEAPAQTHVMISAAGRRSSQVFD